MHNLPENDHWIYPTLRNGEPYQADVSICNVFTCKILKEAGIFGIVVMDSCNEEIFHRGYDWNRKSVLGLESDTQKWLGTFSR